MRSPRIAVMPQPSLVRGPRCDLFSCGVVLDIDIGVELCMFGARSRVKHFCYFCRLRSWRGGHAFTQRLNVPTPGACRLEPRPRSRGDGNRWKPWKPKYGNCTRIHGNRGNRGIMRKEKRVLFLFHEFLRFPRFPFIRVQFPHLVSTGFHGFHQQGHLGSCAWLVRAGSAWPGPAGQVSPGGAVGVGLHVVRVSVRPRLPSALPGALPMRRKRDLRQ